MEEVLKKVVLLGDSAVGKTSLMNRFIKNSFDDSYISTVGARVSKKVVNVNLDDVDYAVSFMLWDIIGNEGYKSTQSRHIAGLNGAIIVADLSRPETIQKLEEYWMPLLEETTAGVMPPILFVGNKLDIVDEETTTRTVRKFIEIDRRMRQQNIVDRYKILHPYIVTSAKTGQGVEDGFRTLGIMMAMEHESYEPLSRQMEEIVADSIYETDDRKTAKSVLDMVISDFPYVVQSSGISRDILQECFGHSNVSKDKPTPHGIKKLIDSLLTKALDEGASEKVVEQHRNKWLEKLERFG